MTEGDMASNQEFGTESRVGAPDPVAVDGGYTSLDPEMQRAVDSIGAATHVYEREFLRVYLW
jgi:hypothetical protein